MTPKYFKKLAENRVGCLLCPHQCVIASGKHGLCQIRHNRNGELTLPYYGRLSALAIDPMEKKPLYHFYPGTRILSAGFWGCSFRCPFCQNYTISQETNQNSGFVAPEELVSQARQSGLAGIAYTYSEPLVHLEYVLETARLARDEGLKNVLVTNGYINPAPAEELLAVTDAANVDLKAFRDPFYKQEIRGTLEPVKNFIKQAASRIHLEVTTLVVPTKNDAEEEIGDLARFLAGIDPEMPYHLSCYYPTYKYSIPRTSLKLVKRLAAVAGRELKHVYLGNVGMEETNTYCPECGNLIIRRRGYKIDISGKRNGNCGKCGHNLNIPGLD